MKTVIDDITGYRLRVFKLSSVTDGVGISALRYDITKPAIKWDALNYLVKNLTGKGFDEYQYLTYETSQYLEWAKTWRGRLSIWFWGGE